MWFLWIRFTIEQGGMYLYALLQGWLYRDKIRPVLLRWIRKNPKGKFKQWLLKVL